MDDLAEDLPRYRINILAKIADVRGAGKGGSVEKLQDTIEDIKTDRRAASRDPLRVLGYAANGGNDELALEMLAHPIPVTSGAHAAQQPRVSG